MIGCNIGGRYMSKFQVGMNIAIFIGTIITFIYFTNKSKLKANGTLEVERKRKLHIINSIDRFI